MSHDISEVTVDGVNVVEAMYANRPAWHGLGSVFDRGGESAPDSSYAIEAAHLGWSVKKVRACYRVGAVSGDSDFAPDQSDTAFVRAADDRYLTVRDDTGAVLGGVGADYSIVQNREAFAFLDGLVKEGLMRYESAFALAGGRRVCLLARMPGVGTVADGDSLLPYVLMRTAHDGTSALVLTPTAVRVVCANTEALALRRARGMAISLRHSGDMAGKLNQAAALLTQYNEAFDGYVENARELAGRKFTDDEARQYIEAVFPAPTGDNVGKRTRTIWEKRIQGVRQSFRSPANNLPAIKGTWWQLAQAVSGYAERGLTYRGEKKEENRLLSLADGNAAEIKRRAITLALKMSS